MKNKNKNFFTFSNFWKWYKQGLHLACTFIFKFFHLKMKVWSQPPSRRKKDGPSVTLIQDSKFSLFFRKCASKGQIEK